MKTKWNDFIGPLMMLMGMSVKIKVRRKMYHVLNCLGVTISFNKVDRMSKRLTSMVESSDKCKLHDILQNEIAVFSIDNLDLTNRHGLLVKGGELWSASNRY